jgi:hypothetical protein
MRFFLRALVLALPALLVLLGVFLPPSFASAQALTTPPPTPAAPDVSAGTNIIFALGALVMVIIFVTVLFHEYHGRTKKVSNEPT